MRIFVTGVAGQLGHDVVEELTRRGHEAVGSDIAAGDYPLDITDRGAARRVLNEVRPDGVVHCAAWTAVDAAEDPANLAKVRAINVDGTRNLAECCRELDLAGNPPRGVPMLYISTDYVFDGQGDKPWEPDCEDYHPLNVYGRSKLDGELAVRETLEKYFIVRTAWVFGANGNNFVKTMLKVGKSHDTVRVVNDQIGTPTYTADLARLLVDMMESDKYGVYHATNAEVREGEYISWYDFTREIYRQAGYAARVIPVTTEEYGLNRAARPFNSRLDKRKLVQAGFAPLPPWTDALSRYLEVSGVALQLHRHTLAPSLQLRTEIF